MKKMHTIRIIAIIGRILVVWYFSMSENFENNAEDGLIINPQCTDPIQTGLKTAKALVLSCMDFRLRDNIKCNLNNLGYKNDYDEFILAGSSLGYNGVQGNYTHWAQVVDDHIKLAYDLHKINTIVLIDHMQCGAYQVAYKLQDAYMDTEKEYNLHKQNLAEAANIIESKYNGSNPQFFQIPNLKIKKYIISIDGGKKVDIDEYKGPFPF